MNRERVQMLRDMMASLPSERIDLDMVFDSGSEREPPKPCGAVACIAGWAWIYPPFVKAGIRKGNPDNAWSAARKFFDVPFDTFDMAVFSDEQGTHKEIALRRLDKILGQTPTTE